MADVRVRVAEGKKLYWRGRDRTGGEIIEVPEKEARLIEAIKKGTRVQAEPVPEPKPRGYQTATVTQGGSGGDKTEPRRYKRRDMRAE